MLKTKVALAGNQTPVSRVSGENSTTEPPMLATSAIFPAQSHKILHSCQKEKLHWGGIAPRSPAWQARILPLNHQCL